MEFLNGRQLKEIDLLNNEHYMTVKDLSEKLGVSEMTIRRDINLLSSQNLVKQVYGGVTAIKDTSLEQNYTVLEEQNKNKTLKEKIVDKALELLNPNDVIFLDSGTTIQLLAERIHPESVFTIITSSFNSLEVIIKLKKSTTIILGGQYSAESHVFYDHESSNYIRNYRANVCFIGATGFDLNHGLTCGYVDDAPRKQAMMESSQKNILLLDSSKFGKVKTCVFAKIEDFATVITDSDIPEKYASHIRDRGVELIIAE